MSRRQCRIITTIRFPKLNTKFFLKMYSLYAHDKADLSGISLSLFLAMLESEILELSRVQEVLRKSIRILHGVYSQLIYF